MPNCSGAFLSGRYERNDKTVTDYTHITELAGDEVSREQVQRISNRYNWARRYCEGRDVLEVACGTGQGAGYLQRHSASYVAADYSWPMVRDVARYYDDRIVVFRADACALPVRDDAFDVIIAFEAVYYFQNLSVFIAECARVIREGGVVLIATANKDLWDFNPSPHSVGYYGVKELGEAFGAAGFDCKFYGDFRVDRVSLVQRMTRPLKWLAVQLGIMPRSNESKKWLKKLIFGGLVEMPRELSERHMLNETMIPVSAGQADRVHKVLMCAATLNHKSQVAPHAS